MARLSSPAFRVLFDLRPEGEDIWMNETRKARVVGELAELEALETRFDRALAGVWIAYQPIVLWSERIVLGYEALARSGEQSLAWPDALFSAAEKLERTWDLGRVVRARVAA